MKKGITIHFSTSFNYDDTDMFWPHYLLYTKVKVANNSKICLFIDIDSKEIRQRPTYYFVEKARSLEVI